MNGDQDLRKRRHCSCYCEFKDKNLMILLYNLSLLVLDIKLWIIIKVEFTRTVWVVDDFSKNTLNMCWNQYRFHGITN